MSVFVVSPEKSWERETVPRQDTPTDRRESSTSMSSIPSSLSSSLGGKMA